MQYSNFANKLNSQLSDGNPATVSPTIKSQFICSIRLCGSQLLNKALDCTLIREQQTAYCSVIFSTFKCSFPHNPAWQRNELWLLSSGIHNSFQQTFRLLWVFKTQKFSQKSVCRKTNPTFGNDTEWALLTGCVCLKGEPAALLSSDNTLTLDIWCRGRSIARPPTLFLYLQLFLQPVSKSVITSSSAVTCSAQWPVRQCAADCLHSTKQICACRSTCNVKPHTVRKCQIPQGGLNAIKSHANAIVFWKSKVCISYFSRQ